MLGGFGCFSSFLVGQDELKVNHQLWGEYNPSYQLDDKIILSSPIGVGTIFDDDWSQFYLKPSVRFNLNRTLEFRGGVGVYRTWRGDKSDRLEIRPWQGIKLNWPQLGLMRFYHYVRIEQRVSFLIDDYERSYDTRLRYKVGFKRRIDNQWQLEGYGEFFFDREEEIDEIFRNRAQVGLALEYRSSSSLSYVIDLKFLRSRLRQEEDFSTSDLKLEFKVNHCLSCPQL